MAEDQSLAARRALLVFASLSESNRKHFMSAINEFLLASPKARHRMMEQWERDHGWLSGNDRSLEKKA